MNVKRENSKRKWIAVICAAVLVFGTFFAGGITPVSASSEGDAYAVLDEEGNFTFFRSTNSYTNNSEGSFTDINGNTWTGRVFAGFEYRNKTGLENCLWADHAKEIKTVDVAEGQDIAPMNISYWFYGCSNMKEADFSGMDTGNTIAMIGTFSKCSALEVLDIRSFSSVRVTSMDGMVTGLKSLQSIGLGRDFRFTSYVEDDVTPVDAPYDPGEKTMRYAVQIMGICVDQIADDPESIQYATDDLGVMTKTGAGNVATSTAGLTFGPATGANYVRTYKSHDPSGNTSAGNAHRCVHNDSWKTIIQWNHDDPYVYEQCIAEGCTHSVLLDKTATETIINRDYDTTSITGDGPGMLFNELISADYSGKYPTYNQENLSWQPGNRVGNEASTGGNTFGGWGMCRMRAMLNGADELTDTSAIRVHSSYTHPSASIYTDSNCLLAAFPEELQSAIGARATRYDSVYSDTSEDNLRTSYDKLWILSPNEVWSNEQNGDDYYSHTLEGNQYESFAAKTNGVIRSTISGQTGTTIYRSGIGDYSSESGVGEAAVWWTRSTIKKTPYGGIYVDGYGFAQRVDCGGQLSSNYAYAWAGITPCFSLNRSIDAGTADDDPTDPQGTDTVAKTWTQYADEAGAPVENGAVISSLIDYNYNYPGWYGATYALTLDPEGGTFRNTTESSTVDVAYGSAINNSVGAAAREQYRFLGWYTEKNGGVQVFDEKGDHVAGDYWTTEGTWKYKDAVTLHAQWVETKEVTITKKWTDGKTGSAAENRIKPVIELESSGASLSTADDESRWEAADDDTWTYTFEVADDDTEYTAAETSVPIGYTSDSPQAVAEDAATITNTISTYTISYEGMDGASYGASHPEEATYDTAFTLNNPTRTGYTFAGWNISGMDEGTTHYWDNSDATTERGTSAEASGVLNTVFMNLRSSDGEVVFTAKWTPRQSGGGSGGGTPVVPDTPEDPGTTDEPEDPTDPSTDPGTTDEPEDPTDPSTDPGTTDEPEDPTDPSTDPGTTDEPEDPTDPSEDPGTSEETEDPADSTFAPLKLRSTSQTTRSIKLRWNKVKGAVRYELYGNTCNKKEKKYKMVRLTSISRRTINVGNINGKFLKKARYYKFRVVALDKDDKVISRSRIVHVATKGGRIGNYRKMTLKTHKNGRKKLAAGDTLKIKVRLIKAKGIVVKKHVGLRYESSDPKVATVSGTGRIKAVAAGTAKITVYAQNGLYKTVRVTVRQ